jgi:hypothetical protein
MAIGGPKKRAVAGLKKKSPKAGPAQAQAAELAGAPSLPVSTTGGPQPLPSHDGKVWFRVRKNDTSSEFAFTPSARIRQAAMQWNYILRNRRRWVNNDAVEREHERELKALLLEHGVDPSALSQLASADRIEVCIPYLGQNEGWELRIFPWEYALAAATHSAREHQLTVWRQLHISNRTPVPQVEPRRILLVEAAPCGLRKEFEFDSERRLVEEAFAGNQFEHELIIDPTRQMLAERVRKFAPDVIHVAGVDIHEAATFLPQQQELILQRSSPGSKSRIRDGLLLRDADNRPEPIEAFELGALLCGGARKPMLVSFNVQNSAGRLASMAVSSGAGAAIGFQDAFDDSLGELFYTSIYDAWSREGLSLCHAFDYAWTEVRGDPSNLQGTGIVMWSDRSWIQSPTTVLPPMASTSLAATKKLEEERETILKPSAQVLAGITLEIKPEEKLNYSMLHNRSCLFKKFVLRKPSGRMHDITVKVNLHAGTVVLPYCACISADKLVKEIGELISIPLTAALTRSARESVRSTLYVAVTWENHTLYEDTHRVTLLPVDEWRDDDTDRIWLPGFVLPRDPAIETIIADARSSLMTLEDDSFAGFDGYQRLATDPGLPVAERAEAVDLQVRAIWSALAFFRRLGYINPPPVYTKSSQRLRMPSDILRSNSGTCIDLTLLLAACLEYVDIHPVIFLLEGHAFPGYWRDNDAYKKFADNPKRQQPVNESSDDARAEEGEPADGKSVQRHAWYFEKSQYGEILQEIYTGNLVPLEAVNLTTRTGFDDAIEEGRNNLRSRAEFHSMIDIMLARSRDVTPLPVREEEI